MKKLLISMILGGGAMSVVAQKVDLDKFTFTANYRILPRKPLDTSYHTFDVDVKTGPLSKVSIQESELEKMLNISGWRRLDDKAHVSVQVKMEDVLVEKTELQQRDDIQKDKYGKEIGRKTWYYQVLTYSFAAEATVVDFRGNQIMTLPLANRDYKRSYKGSEFATANEANIDYRYSQILTLNQIIRQTTTAAMNDLSNILTGNFGYQETTVTDFLWILNTRKNPENDNYHQAWVNFKSAMFTMSADEPLDKVRAMMQPTIDYLNGIKKKYRSNSKSDRKIRYASFYNLAKIYYYLDDPDAALAEASALQVNDFDGRDGRQLEAAATDLKFQLKQNQIHSRHFAVHPESYQGPYAMASSSMY